MAEIKNVTVHVGDKDITIPNDRDTLYLRWANGDQDAAQVILYVGLACQRADDLVDDKNLPDASGVMTELLLIFGGALQRNSFYEKHRKTLEPVILSSVLYWDMANTLVAGEQHGTAGDRLYAFAFRELIEQIVGIVALLTGGVAHARLSLLESYAWHHVTNRESFEHFEKELLAT